MMRGSCRRTILGSVFFFTLIFLSLSCPTYHVPALPMQKDLAFDTSCVDMTEVGPTQVKALFLNPRPEVIGLSPEAGYTPLVQMVSVVDQEGRLLFNDILHEEAPYHTLTHGKLSLKGLDIKPIAGTLDDRYRFRPSRDVLTSLDSGFGIEIEVGGQRDRVVVPPLYDASGYKPYTRKGKSKSSGKQGYSPTGRGIASSGKDGRNGKTGGTGQNGANGEDGASKGENARNFGQDGGNGGDGGSGGDGGDGLRGSDNLSPGGTGYQGGNGGRGGAGGNGKNGGTGFYGADGKRGEDGERGEDGPMLKIAFRPIFSKFYPEEDLVYASIDATWRDIHGNIYKREKKNYVFHKNQTFRIKSIGGKGGDGGQGGHGGNGGRGGSSGDGGDGGDGGNGGGGGSGGPPDLASGTPAGTRGPGGSGGNGGRGGNGGAGGNGAPNGCGGNGGNGGRGGDGGRIKVEVNGPTVFQNAVRQYMTFFSIPGRGGKGGGGGNPGRAGSGGYKGRGGDGGDGGLGGFGSPSGRVGEDGADGKCGSAGNPGRTKKCCSRAGRSGLGGRPGAVHFH